MENPFAYLIPKDVSEHATSEALEKAGPETSEVAFTPVDAATFKRPPTQPEAVNLDAPDLTQSFVDDMRQATLRTSGVDVNPHSLGRTPRQVLTNAIARQILPFNFKPSEDMGALDGYWSEFKSEMDPSVPGFFEAVGRGMKEAVGPTIGGVAGAAVGSIIPFGGTLVGGYLGSKAGGWAQEVLFPPTEEDITRAIADFELPSTRYGRMLGNYLVGILNGTNKLEWAIPKNRPELISKAIESTLPNAIRIAEETYQGMKAGQGFGESLQSAAEPQKFVEQLVFDATSALATKPNQVGKYLFDKEYRTQVAAQKRAANAFINAAGAGEALKAAETIAYNEGNLNTQGVNVGSGNLSQNLGLIALQGVLERRLSETEGARLQSMKMASTRQIGKNLGESLKPSGKSPEELSYIFAGQNESAIKALEAARNDAISRNDTKANDILMRALTAIDETRKQAQDSLLSTEDAFAKTTRELQDATEALTNYNGMLTKELASQMVRDRFETNRADTIKPIEEMYIEASQQGAITDFKNTFKAAVEAMGARSREAQAAGLDESPRVAQILKERAPDESGNYQLFPISDLTKLLSEISSDIRNLPPEKRGLNRQLNNVRNAIHKDLDAAGEVYPLIKKANLAYKDFADRFLNKTSSNILHEDVGVFIDKFVAAKGVEELRRLRSALVNPGTDILPQPAAETLALFQLNSLANKGITQSKQLNKWMQSNEGSHFLNTFPEAAPQIKTVIENIANAQTAVDSALEGTQTAKKNLANITALNNRQQKILEASANDLKNAGARKAEQIFQSKQKSIIDQAATVFIGSEPLKAFDAAMTSDNRPAAIQNLAARALLDQSGAAIEALRNTARAWINEKMRNDGNAVMESLDPKKKVDPNERRVSDAKLMDFLADENAIQALGIVLDSRELYALNLAHRQTRAMQQRLGVSAGESATQLNRMMDMTVDQGLENNLLGGLFRILRSADASYKKQNTNFVNSALNVVHKAWKGDVPTLALSALQDAISQPQLAIEMLRGTQENPERSRAVLQNWLIWHRRNSPYQPLPFSPQNTSTEDLRDGSVQIDTLYGYKVYQMPNKKFRLVSPTGKTSFHESLMDAHNKAVNQTIQQNATP